LHIADAALREADEHARAGRRIRDKDFKAQLEAP